jgi:hypothetical protein
MLSKFYSVLSLGEFSSIVFDISDLFLNVGFDAVGSPLKFGFIVPMEITMRNNER